MRRQRKAAVTTLAAVSGCLILATQAPMVASAAATGVKGDVSITNTETVDAKLSATGTVSSQRIYDQLIVTGDGSVDIENPVSTDGLRNLNGFGGPSVRDGKQRISTSVKGEKAYRSVADYDGDLPVDVRVEYRLDGEKVKPGDVVGKDGTLEVTYSVRNMTGEQQEVTYTDGEGNEQTRTMAVVVPLVGSMSTVLPSNFTDVQSEQANAAGDGKGGTLLSFTMTLFPPIGSDRTTFGYTAEITDGIIPEANMSVLPVNPLESPSFSGGAESYKGGADAGVDLTEGAAKIDQNLLKIRDGAEELVAGILQLDDGAGQLRSGTGELSAGANKLSGGAGELNSGAQQLNAGAGRANSGAQQLSDGAQKANSGAVRLRDGSAQVSEGNSALFDGLRQLAAGTAQLKTGSGDLDSGATRLVTGAGELDDGAQQLSAGLVQLAGGSAQVASGATNLAKGAGTLDEGLKNAAENAPLLVQGAGQLSGGLDQLAGSLPQAQAGVSGVAGGLGQLNTSLGQIRAGVLGLKGYAPLIQDATARTQFEGAVDQLAVGLEQGSGGLTTTMIPTLQQVSGGLQAAVSGLGAAGEEDTLRGGAAQLVAGLQALETGLDQASAGSGALYEGAQKLAEGATQVNTGVPTLRDGAGRLAGGTADLRENSKVLKDGTSRLSAGAVQVDGGTRTATGAAGQLADGSSQVATGLVELQSGLGRLAPGAAELANGTVQLFAGTVRLAAGTGELAPGAVKLAEGAGKLNEGAGKLADGLDQAAQKAPALPEGAQQLSEQGTSQLINVGNATAMDYGEKYALIEAGAERAAQLQPYGSPEGATSRTAYKLTLSAEDGEDRANVLRAGAAAVVALLGLGGLALRRRLR